VPPYLPRPKQNRDRKGPAGSNPVSASCQTATTGHAERPNEFDLLNVPSASLRSSEDSPRLHPLRAACQARFHNKTPGASWDGRPLFTVPKSCCLPKILLLRSILRPRPTSIEPSTVAVTELPGLWRWLCIQHSTAKGRSRYQKILGPRPILPPWPKGLLIGGSRSA
jgi:hypothetical protein